ncbi:MAG TPA: hypothetical protein VMU82_01720, partial [Acetobacteraceae bacterium]|nr:hypothetical protein [Acetobacteraceae bacterium]
VDPSAPDQVLRGPVNVRARIWGGAGIVRVRCRVDGGRAWTMAPIPDEPAMWHGVRDLSDLADGLHRLTVQAEDAAGGVDEDAITVRMSRSGACAAPRRAAPGSEANAIGAWPEKGIPGGQLGPNRNGRKW